MNKYSHIDIGQIGEEATVEYYKRLGFKFVDKNYWKPFGEIDVVVEKDNQLVFVEVKSVSCIDFDEEHTNPAENVHREKLRRLRSVVGEYLREKGGVHDGWRFDVAVVQVNTKLKRSRVEIIEDVII